MTGARKSGPRRPTPPVIAALVLALAVLAVHALELDAVFVAVSRGLVILLAPLALHLWRKRPRFAHWALGPAVLAMIHALIALSGGVASSPAYPLIYVWLAFAAGLLALGPAIFTVMLAGAFEVVLYTQTGAPALPELVAHLGFMIVFAALFGALLAAEIRALRKTHDATVQAELERVEQDAHDFRLIGSSLRTVSADERDPRDAKRTRQVGSVRAIRESLVDVLEVVRLAVHADTAMLFMLNDAGSRLKLKECVASGGERSIIERPIPATEGALGAVVKTRRSVNLLPREGGRGLGYRTRADVGSFLGVPVLDEGHLAGVLAVDRARVEAFGDQDEELLEAVAREAMRAIESERIFVSMDRVKYEQERLYEAFALLNEALTVEASAEQLLEAAARIRKVDFACVTLFDEEKSTHAIVGLRAESAESVKALSGATFANKDGGLVAMAMKNGHALPYVPLSEQPDRAKLVLFGKLDHPELQSVKVFPLSERGKPLGALVLGSTVPGAELAREEERMLDIVCTHAAITLANARMYKKMEMMATTDGLTGLVNHRRFKELLDEALARATRFERNVSVVMVDADHFKSVNDTYGHPVGDLVLKKIAAILQAEARRTDVVARYGGEEFVVVLDETDRAGAEMVAERMRERIEREVIQGDFGRVRVTASLGVATWPDHAGSMEDLLEKADQALYEAKRKGRNRVIVSRGTHCAQPDRGAIRGKEGATEHRSM